MEHIFCFGDSNTYGYDARSMFGERLPETERWPDILEKRFGWKVINAGMNGRRIPQEPWSLESFDHQLSKEKDVDLILIMLGTNDLLDSFSPDIKKTGACMEQFICHVLRHPAVDGNGNKILLVAPPPTNIGHFDEENAWYDKEAGKFGSCYKEIAEKYGLRFADAGQWKLPLAHDGVHISPEGHKIFAEKIGEVLQMQPD